MGAIQSTDPAATSGAAAQSSGYDAAGFGASDVGAGDVGEEIASLFVQNADGERRAAQQQLDTELQVEQQADQAEVQAMHDAASSMRTQGYTDFAWGGVSSAVTYYCPEAGPAMQQGGKLVDSVFAADQKDDDANAAQNKATADQAHNAANRDEDAANDANSVRNAALEFDRTYHTTWAETQLAALHRV
jgi:hypothetical protein